MTRITGFGIDKIKGDTIFQFADIGDLVGAIYRDGIVLSFWYLK